MPFTAGVNSSPHVYSLNGGFSHTICFPLHHFAARPSDVKIVVGDLLHYSVCVTPLHGKAKKGKNKNPLVDLFRTHLMSTKYPPWQIRSR